MLISTYDIINWLSIPEGDKRANPKLASISLAVQDFVDSFCNRELEAKRYLTDPNFCYYDGTGRSYIYTKAYPISYVSSVNVDYFRSFATATLLPSSSLFWYPSGKIALDNATGLYGYFSKGRRNILIDYTAGYAPVVGGTHNMAVSTYPIPNDLKQVMIEMCAESFKEGVTAIHSVQSQQPGGDTKIVQMLSKNSFWFNTLNKYKAFDAMLNDRDEE